MISFLKLVSIYDDIFPNLLPNFLSSYAMFIGSIIEIHFIGRFGDLRLLDGTGFAIFFKHLIFYYLVYAFTEAIPVVCSKSFGKKNFKLLGEQMNQIRILTYVAFLILSIIFFSSPDKVLLFFAGEKNKDYLTISATYLKFVYPGIFFDMNYAILAKYAEAHLEFKMINYSTIFSIVMHPVIAYILIIVFDLKEIGAGIASSIISFFKFGFLFLSIQFNFKYPESNFFISKDTFNWKVFKETFKVAVYSALIYFAASGGVICLVLISTRLSDLSYTKYIIFTNVADFNFIHCYSFMATATNLVGNYIGSNSISNMKRVIKILFLLGLFIQLLLILVYIIFNKQIAYFFSTNPEVYLQISGLMICAALLYLCHFLMYFLTGILRVCDKLEVTIIYLTIGLCVLNPLLAYLLTFTAKFDIWGIINGELIITALLNIVLIILFFTLDFQKVCEEFQKLVLKENQALENENQEESSILLNKED